MILVWTLAVPLAGLLTAGLVWLLRRVAPAAPAPVVVVTDPLHPDWKPSGELAEPVLYRLPPSWDWPSFTQQWPVINNIDMRQNP